MIGKDSMTTSQFRTETERNTTLTQKEQEQVLRIEPSFESISEAVYFDNYDLPCPIRVSVVTKENETVTVVVRKNQQTDLDNEIHIFHALKEFGLPVPEVLVEPFESEESEYATILSLLPGENLQKLGMKSAEGLIQAKKLLVEAVTTLAGATDFMRKHEIAKNIPSASLLKGLEELNSEENPWFTEKVFQNASQKLKPILENITTPLVFSNGDYQPGNFLTQDGKITGFLDFESVSFQDPLMGFVKYPIYDLLP